MKKLFLLAAVLSSALTLTACGGGGGGERISVVPTDTTLAVTPTTGATIVAAVQGREFDFPTGVPSFGTTATTTVALTTAAAGGSPGFTITETGVGSASGTLEFGSCRFRITQSNYPADHPLAQGKIITVERCEVSVDTDNTPADTVERTKSAFLRLNAAQSSGEPIRVNVTPSGQLILGGVTVLPSITLVVVTGG